MKLKENANQLTTKTIAHSSEGKIFSFNNHSLTLSDRSTMLDTQLTKGDHRVYINHEEIISIHEPPCHCMRIFPFSTMTPGLIKAKSSPAFRLPALPCWPYNTSAFHPTFPKAARPRNYRAFLLEMLSRTSKQTFEAEAICPNPQRISETTNMLKFYGDSDMIHHE